MKNKLIAYRKLLNITQSEMAEKLGIGLATYNRKETGKIPFNQFEMIKITQIFKEHIPEITMDEIFFNHELSKLLNKVS